MNRAFKIIFWLSFVYIIVALVFWGDKLYKQSETINQLKYNIIKEKRDNDIITEAEYLDSIKKNSQKSKSKKIQYIGEGVTFLLLIIGTGIIVYILLKKDSKHNQIQKDFILSFTHELKTPLTGIKLALQTLKRENINQTQKNEIGETILIEINRLNDLVSNLLHITKLESKQIKIQKERINVMDTVKSIVDDYRYIREGNSIDIKGDIIWINANKSMFKVIVSNLISNAIKNNSEGSNVIVVLKSLSRVNYIEIIDHGYGIVDDINKYTDNSKTGLYIVEKLCKLYSIMLSYHRNHGQTIFKLMWKK